VRALGLSVVAFSGYRLEELLAPPLAGPAVARLLRAVDVLVDGRYESGQPDDSRPWVGSRNQRFHYLTARYSPAIERTGVEGPVRTVEVRLSPDGRVSVNGWPVGLGMKAGGRPVRESGRRGDQNEEPSRSRQREERPGRSSGRT